MIPNNLDECFAALNKMLSESELDDIRTMDELQLSSLHHGLGQWIRNNWGLWAGGTLAKYFNNLGLSHPDDMSGLIITTFWHHLKGEPLGIDREIKKYQDFWKRTNI